MRRREFFGVIGAVASLPLATQAQPPAMPVIGFLSSGMSTGLEYLTAAFRQGLGEAGYVEGRNVAIEYRWAEVQYDRLPVMAADLVRRRVSVVLAGTPPAALAAKTATSSIPIVFIAGADPIAIGLVDSLSPPSSNITGVSNYLSNLGQSDLNCSASWSPTPL
jgi:putative tryptophan/tyrosine transport system substrate-binding protein